MSIPSHTGYVAFIWEKKCCSLSEQKQVCINLHLIHIDWSIVVETHCEVFSAVIFLAGSGVLQQPLQGYACSKTLTCTSTIYLRLTGFVQQASRLLSLLPLQHSTSIETWVLYKELQSGTPMTGTVARSTGSATAQHTNNAELS